MIKTGSYTECLDKSIDEICKDYVLLLQAESFNNLDLDLNFYIEKMKNNLIKFHDVESCSIIYKKTNKGDYCFSFVYKKRYDNKASAFEIRCNLF